MTVVNSYLLIVIPLLLVWINIVQGQSPMIINISQPSININVDGISGPGRAIGNKGTIQWFIEDDEGTVHVMFHNTNLEKTRCIQYHDWAVLHWGPNEEFTKTVYNNPATDVPDMQSAPSNRSYAAYAAISSKITQVDKFEFVCFPTVVSEDDKESITSESVLSENSGDTDILQDDASKVLCITLTKQRYRAATVIVDHYSDFYIHSFARVNVFP